MNAQLGAALGNLLAGLVAGAVRARHKAVLVDLDDLILLASDGEHLVDIERHGGATDVPQHKDLLVLKRADVHLRGLREARSLCELFVMYARYHVIELRAGALKEGARLFERAPHDVLGTDDVLAKQRAVKRDDVGFGAAQQRHAVPLARPAYLIDKELVVAQVKRRRDHTRKVVGRAQHLKSGLGRSAHVLLDSRVRVARIQRVGVNIAAKFHGPTPYARYSSASAFQAGSEFTMVSCEMQ